MGPEASRALSALAFQADDPGEQGGNKQADSDLDVGQHLTSARSLNGCGQSP